MSQKVNTNIRIDKDIKEKAKKIANEQGTNLSTVLNMYLIDYIETGEIRYKKSIENFEIEDFSSDEIEALEKLSNFKGFTKSVSGI